MARQKNPVNAVADAMLVVILFALSALVAVVPAVVIAIGIPVIVLHQLITRRSRREQGGVSSICVYRHEAAADPAPHYARADRHAA